MNLQNRIGLFSALGKYLEENTPGWQDAKREASLKNPWFTEAFIDTATKNIIKKYLQKDLLQLWAAHYHLDDPILPVNVGIIMAGNIPMVGFHDLLSVFISGHKQQIKLSSKDDVLMKHLVQQLYTLNNEAEDWITIADNLKGCDAYIATGGSQSARYFEQYFSKYPHIIRSNKTSVAILTGEETEAELEQLSTDIHLYFGLGCRNVTKIYVPKGYDFIPLLRSFNKFRHLTDLTKYANNYDYQLSLLLLNHQYYMTNESTLLVENDNLFSPISVVHFTYYDDHQKIIASLKENESIQCIIGRGQLPFGAAQEPGLFSYADGVDTQQFLLTL